MRTNIVIDDQLMSAAMRAGDFKTKKDAVEEGLRLLARRKAYQDIRALRGKLHWDIQGDWSVPHSTLQDNRVAYKVERKA
jgi:antitoxin ParD1/3/4